MRGTDVRDVEGRLWRLLWSLEAGIALAVAIATLLPAFRRVNAGPSAFAIPALVIAGACGITMAIYALLGALARRPKRRRVRLPRARLVRRV